MIFNKPFSDITIDDIRKLVEDKIEESVILDYKRELTNNKDIAKDVSAFANSEGGVIIYGVAENENHLPTSIIGIEGEGAQEKIENVIITGIRPRPSFLIKPILINENSAKRVIAVLIHQSLYAPHMVTIDRDNRYYKRFNFSSVPMEDYEVRALFERRKSFLDRVDKELKARNYGLLAPDSSRGWWTFISCPLFLDDRLVAIDHEHRSWLEIYRREFDFLPALPRPSYNGFLMEGRGENLSCRVEVSRQGIIVYSKRIDAQNSIPSLVLAKELLMFLGFANELYEKVSYYGPVKLVLGLANIKGYRLAVRNRWESDDKGRIIEDENLPPVLREISAPNIKSELSGIAADIMDQVYQAFGYWGCEWFDEERNFIGDIEENGIKPSKII